MPQVVVDSVDDTVALWIATHRVAALNDVFVWLGTIEKLGLVWIVLALVVGAVLRLGVVPTLALAVLTGLAAFAADSASYGLKNVVDRTRPFEAHPAIQPLYTVHSSSFPAGHAATAFVGATLLSYVAPRATPLFLALAIAIAFSRVYVGVHYPSDVLAGAALGAAVGGLAVLLVAAARRRGFGAAAALTGR